MIEANYRPTLDNLRGIMWMLLAAVCLTAMFGILKYMANELPFCVVALMRTTVALVLFLPWFLHSGISGLATKRIGLHFLRAFSGTASFICVIYALGELLMSDTMVLSFTTPFWSIIISTLILGEIVRRHRIMATIVGFIGVVMIIKPQNEIDPAMFVAVGSALFTSIAMVSMKALTSSEPPMRILFYFFLIGTLLLLIPAIITWQTPNPVQFSWLIGAGLLGAVGQNFLARAYDAAEVGVVAPFDFVRLPFAALLGYLVFGEIIDLWSGGGTVVIIGASLYIAHREARIRAGTK